MTTEATNQLQDHAHAIASKPIAKLVYLLTRIFLRVFLWSYLRVSSSGQEYLKGQGSLIIAPVHRSNLDSVLLAPLTRRRLRALAKESLFKVRPFAWYISALGAFPIKRESVDRESLRSALSVLENGETMLVFPEGTRQLGDTIGDLYGGAAYLAAKSSTPVVPVGIAGTEEAMAQGVRIPRPKKVCIVVGEPIHPPDLEAKHRDLREWTVELSIRLQAVQDLARSRVG